jgi:hypothetical protein
LLLDRQQADAGVVERRELRRPGDARAAGRGDRVQLVGIVDRIDGKAPR